MKRVLLVGLLVLPMIGCAYGGVASVNGGKDVIITRNDHCLGGALRKVYACKSVKGGGLSGCKETTAP